MRIVGIDPGLATIGIGLVETSSPGDIRALEWLTIETHSLLPLPDRLREIGEDLMAYLTEATPDLAVVERLYFARNEKTAMDVAQARGVILSVIAMHGIPIIEPSPSEMKSAITGDGNADKEQIQTMLVAIFKLHAPPRPDDAADALALAAFGAFRKEGIVLA